MQGNPGFLQSQVLELFPPWGWTHVLQKGLNILAKCPKGMGTSEAALLDVCHGCEWVLVTWLLGDLTGSLRLVLSLRGDAGPEAGSHRLLHLSL